MGSGGHTVVVKHCDGGHSLAYKDLLLNLTKTHVAWCLVLRPFSLCHTKTYRGRTPALQHRSVESKHMQGIGLHSGAVNMSDWQVIL